MRHVLENDGVVFVSGDTQCGPGVRLVAGRPNIIRRPTRLTAWVGLPFSIEWQGKEITVLVSKEVLEDMGGLAGIELDAAYIKVFEANVGIILDVIKRIIHDQGNFDKEGNLYVKSKDMEAQ